MQHYIWSNPNWTAFTWDEKTLLPLIGRARLKQGELTAKIKALHLDSSSTTHAEVLIEETLRTAQIEGEIYDPQSVRSSVHRKLGLPHAGLPATQRHVDGLVEMLIDATQNNHQDLTNKKLKTWHAALFPTGYSGLRAIRTGKLRNDASGPMQVVSGPFGKERVHYQAPPADMLNQEVRSFLKWWKQSKGKTEGILRAGVAHFYFITLHPFDDGNGRIARALTDMALAQDDQLSKRYYSLSKQILSEKKQYYKVLEETQKGGSNITPWLVWFLECYAAALNQSETIMADVLHKATFWQKHQGQVNARQRKVLNKLLDLGKGKFTGGLTTRKYTAIAKTSRVTAYREIQDLVTKKMLKKNPGKGRNVSYDVAW